MLDGRPLGLVFVREAVGDCLELGERPRLGPSCGPHPGDNRLSEGLRKDRHG